MFSLIHEILFLSRSIDLQHRLQITKKKRERERSVYGSREIRRVVCAMQRESINTISLSFVGCVENQTPRRFQRVNAFFG